MDHDNFKLQDALERMQETAFADGWTDQRMDKAAQKLLAKHGRPGETIVWDPAFGGGWKIIKGA